MIIGCLYLPNGNPYPGPKFDYKLKWFNRLIAHSKKLLALKKPVALIGDFNVMPTELDTYKPKKYINDALFRIETRKAYQKLLEQGWTDAIRKLYPKKAIYTFWDYFRNAYARDAGMHVHFMQDECFTIKSGKAGYQTAGGEQKFASEGETFLFKRGVMHRFWNAGDTELVVNSWVKPAHSIVFFLSAVYAAQKKSGKHQPDQFDGAYLLTKYKSEYAMGDISPFVRNVIIPITYQMGKMMGKYKKFKDAPEPVK